MPSKNDNIIGKLRRKYEPHMQLSAKVDLNHNIIHAIEGKLEDLPKIHKTLSKSFGMQRKTLMRVLALEKQVAELRGEKQPQEQDIGDWADESGEWSSSGETSSTAEEGGETTTQTPTATATKISANRFKKGTSQESVEERLARLESNRKDAAAAEEYKKTDEYKESITATDEEGDYLSAAERKARFKKTKITGADIKKGSSVGGAEKIAAEVDANQKAAIEKAKIDIATKYEGSSADGVTPADADAEKGGALAKGTESLIGPLKTIDSGVNGIIETLKVSNKADAKEQSDARKRAEKEARAQKEGKLEGIKGKLGKAAETVLKPVQNIFQKIWDFLKIVLLGRVVMKLFEWFTNPANGEKVASLFRFLKDWWPVLVAGIMAVVGPGMIFTAGLIALLVWGIPKIIEAVKWVGSLFGIGVDKELKNVEKESAKMGDDITDKMDKDLTKDAEEITDKQAEVGDNETPATDVTPSEVGETQQQSQDVQSGADQTGELPTKMAGGGQVPGSGSGDTVPAMLTPGEFVMSKGAVQQYGADTLAGMNAAAGGTNRPTRGGYKSGGIVNNMSKNSVQNVKGGSRDTTNSISSSNSTRYSSSSSNSARNVGGPRIHYNGGGIVNMNRFGGDKSTLPRIPVQYFKGGGEVKKPQGMMRWLAGAADVATGGVFDFDKRGSIADGAKRMADKKNDNAAKIVKSSPSQIVINPPPSFSPEVITEDPVGDANLKVNNRTAPSQELPEFSAGKMRSMSKIKTLGIAV